jgi:hypothetical protein
MNTMTPQDWMLVAIAAMVVVAAVVAWVAWRGRQTSRLQQRFGAEYGRAVDDRGSRSKAESDLKARQARVDALHIVALSPAEAARFSQEWLALQGRFLDNPKGVVTQADELVRALMQARGYPVADFDRRAEDLSVGYPEMVGHYRAAQALALRNRRGETSTEEQRQAVVHYRALFDELLGVATAEASAPFEPVTALAPSASLDPRPVAVPPSRAPL